MCLQEEQITKNILKSWDVQRSMHAEVKRVLEVAKRKKRSERVVRMVDAAARGIIEEVGVVYLEICDEHVLICVSCTRSTRRTRWTLPPTRPLKR